MLRSKFFCANPQKLNEIRLLRWYSKPLCGVEISRITKKVASYEDELPNTYTPGNVEPEWYDWWQSQGYFKPKEKDGKTFSMVLPPPNVTGTLHIGHALVVTLQDVLSRWRRMKGESVLWIPGTDHAGIATQVVVEKYLKNEMNKSKHELGKEKFVEQVWKWKEKKGGTILQQLKMMGASVDWDHYVFTMDKNQNEAVNCAFINLYKQGLIYRKNALVNWSCHLQSSISDIEVEKMEVEKEMKYSVPGYDEPVVLGTLTDFAYSLCDEAGELVVSTTRPETMLGDVAVAVNPSDNRYQSYRGKHVWHPFRKCKIPVIFDEFVDPKFGSGVVKITPAHDPVDFEVGLRHKLPIINVINEKGEMCNSDVFNGIQRYKARTMTCEKLKELGLFRGCRDHKMIVPVCSRSGDVVEYLLKPQWFLDCKEMGQRALDAVNNQELVLIPNKFEKVWKNWLENIKDWNVSRQLWWGHPVPMYECKTADGECMWIAANSREEAVSKSKRSDIVDVRQDDDVLDTWFSSALFPFSTLGWPKDGQQLSTCYPLSLMVTGHDIMFFWVARMVMLGQQLTGKLPFNKVLFHGVVCDSRGKKMSKSKGNVLNPEDIINGIELKQLQKQTQDAYTSGTITEEQMKIAKQEQAKMFPNGIPKCGADALRFTLCTVDVQNEFINFDLSYAVSNSHFCNKIWQTYKYYHGCLQSRDVSLVTTVIDEDGMNLFDKWIMSRLANMVQVVNTSLGEFKFHTATGVFRDFYYSDFCDVYLETTKPVFKEGSPQAQSAVLSILFNCIETSLRVLSPFMPYLCEELYQRLPRVDKFEHVESVMLARYPLPEEYCKWSDRQVERQIAQVLRVVGCVRSLRKFYEVPKAQTSVNIKTQLKRYDELQAFLSHLTNIHALTVNGKTPEECPSTWLPIHDNGQVGLYFNISQQEFIEKNQVILKREEKLKEKYEKLLSVTTKPGYSKKALEGLQKSNAIKLQNMEAELSRILEIKKSFLKS